MILLVLLLLRHKTHFTDGKSKHSIGAVVCCRENCCSKFVLLMFSLSFLGIRIEHRDMCICSYYSYERIMHSAHRYCQLKYVCMQNANLHFICVIHYTSAIVWAHQKYHNFLNIKFSFARRFLFCRTDLCCISIIRNSAKYCAILRNKSTHFIHITRYDCQFFFDVKSDDINEIQLSSDEWDKLKWKLFRMTIRFDWKTKRFHWQQCVFENLWRWTQIKTIIKRELVFNIEKFGSLSRQTESFWTSAETVEQ